MLSRSVGQLYGSSELSDVVVEAVRARMLPPAHNPPTPLSIPLPARYECTALSAREHKLRLGRAQRRRQVEYPGQPPPHYRLPAHRVVLAGWSEVRAVSR